MSRKLIFIDDSGCTGFKFGQGSTNYFGIAAVFFDDDLDAEEAALKIKRLRRSLCWHDLHEFKFRKTSGSIRKQFLETVRSLNYRVVIALIDKRNVNDIKLQENPSEFYYNVILRTLQIGDGFVKANIIIDGKKGIDHRRKVKSFFRKNLPEFSVNKISFRDSQKDSLIQLADMIVGAAMHSLEKRDDSKDYISIIEKRIYKIFTEL